MTKAINTKRLIIISMIIAVAIAVSFCLPKPKYKSPNILPTLDIPYKMSGWIGKDISQELNTRDLRYNFINQIFAKAYMNNYGENLTLLILDAGNFHNPKVCFGMSGYKVTDLPDTDLNIGDRVIKAHTIFFEKQGSSTVIFYWISINKKIVDWNQQKIIQLWYSLLNKQKTGLMVRIEVPAQKETIQSAIKLAKEFIRDISPQIPLEQKEYLFGK